MNRDATLIAYRALSDVAGKGAFFLVTILAARGLTEDAFGVFSLGSTFGWIAAVATDFGIQLQVARAIARRPGDAHQILRAWLRVRLWTGAIAVAAVAVGLAAMGTDLAIAPAILLFALVYVVSGLIEFLHYFYRGLSRSDIESTLTLCLRLGTVGCAALALAWRPDVTTLAVAMLVPAVATLAYSARRAVRLARATSEGGDVGGDVPRSAANVGVELRRDVIPIGIGIVLSALYFRIDIFLINMWSGTVAVGLYNAVFRLVEALRLFPAAVLAVTLPALCRSTNTRLLFQVSAAVTAFGAVVSLVLIVAADQLVVLLYGEPYATALPAFRILLASFPLMSLNYALTHQLIGWNGHSAYAVVCGAALLFNVALNSRLVPTAGIVGAAWATLWTEALVAVGCATALSRVAAPMMAGRAGGAGKPAAADSGGRCDVLSWIRASTTVRARRARGWGPAHKEKVGP